MTIADVASLRGTTETTGRRQRDAGTPANQPDLHQVTAEHVSAPPPESTVDADSSRVTTLEATVVSPFANQAPSMPTKPMDVPIVWTALAFARREFGQTSTKEWPTVNPLAGRILNGLVTESPQLDGQSSVATMIRNIVAPMSATATPAVFTGQPSILSRVLTATFGVVSQLSTVLNVDLTIPLLRLVSSDHPPKITTLGLDVQRTEFEGMPVYVLKSPGSTSEETVVAIHGGALTIDPPVFNWLLYAQMARETGATVIVPIYPLVQQGGTASTVVPVIADLISSQIYEHGADNVSVFGDSAGGNIGLVAVQELVLRGDPVPSRMVLISPGVDSTLSNPVIASVDDPVLSPAVLRDFNGYLELWADGLEISDPLLSPINGSLAGLPPTTIYAGSRDVTWPDLILLQDKASATPGADLTLVLREGEPHDWVALMFLPETQAVLPDIYEQLGIATSSN